MSFADNACVTEDTFTLRQLRGKVTAREKFEEALNVGTRSNDLSVQARANNGLGLIAKKKGALEEAMQYFFKSLAIHEKLNNLEGISSTSLNIGVIFDYQGNRKKAIEYFGA